MKILKMLVSSILILQIIACKENSTTVNAVFKFEKSDKEFKLNDVIRFSVSTAAGQNIDSIRYNFQDKSKTVIGNQASISLKNVLLGKHDLKINYFSQGESKEYKTNVTVLNDKSPVVLGYKIVTSYPHSTSDYTQGLEFNNDKLYESAGKYGESRLLQKDLVTGKAILEHQLSNDFFAEGLTIVGNKIHQLTWKGDMGYSYDITNFKVLGTFAYNKSKQGWGLCYDDEKTIYKSDGTTKIWKLNSETLKEEGFIQITTNKALKSKFNELEWIDGKIYANTWQKDSIAIINPENGAIEAIINLSGIREKVGVSSSDKDKVLNGIAYNNKNRKLYITGKYWDKLFEIELVK